ncbi:MAG TPA: hypothetical protein PK562_07595, partial [Candidatus Omnitrophota bacterium]|nr:hypothetical protein [Candidatus Omnitrophota bacterium]
FYATKSKRKAFWYSFLSGFAEPAGAVLAILVLMPFLSAAVLSIALAVVAGVMVLSVSTSCSRCPVRATGIISLFSGSSWAWQSWQ